MHGIVLLNLNFMNFVSDFVDDSGNHHVCSAHPTSFPIWLDTKPYI